MTLGPEQSTPDQPVEPTPPAGGRNESGSPSAQFSNAESGHALRYQTHIDLNEENTSQTQIILLAGRNKKVLEVGPATGDMSKVLEERGCRVTGLEIDPVAAKVGEQYCERMIVGDIEQDEPRRVLR